MAKHFYRFRSVENLLGKYQELQRQAIYFASPSQQNDPMEGLIDLRWLGDAILWRNFFLHYFRCLYLGVSQLNVAGSDGDITVPIFANSTSLPVMEASFPYRLAKAKFLADCDLRAATRMLGSRKRMTGQNEALWLLCQIHGQAVTSILNSMNEAGLSATSGQFRKKPSSLSEQIRLFDKIALERETSFAKTEALHRHLLGGLTEMEFITFYNNEAKHEKGKRQVFFSFPRMYMIALRKLVHSNWYTASFSTNGTNSSMWSHYADNHKGVCLVFRATEDKDGICSLPLKGSIGIYGDQTGSRLIIGDRPYQFYHVGYKEKHPPIHFFETLGTLPMPVLLSDWYSEGKRRSAVQSGLINDDDAWKKNYWAQLLKNATTKTRDWAYEEEARLVLIGTLGEKSDEERIFEYDFSSLEGVILGVNITEEDKIALAKVIERKCRSLGRTDFKFFQAYYDQASGTIQVDELKFLRWDFASDSGETRSEPRRTGVANGSI